MSSHLLTAAEFARVCQVTPRTIRWYQKMGLIKPVQVDRWNKYAYFAPEQSLKVFRIKLLQQFDLPLSKISDLVNAKKLSLHEELAKLDKFIEEKKRELVFLKGVNKLIVLENEPKFNKETVGPYRLFCRRIENGDYYKIGDYIDDLRRVAKELGLKIRDSEITFYLDSELEYRPKRTNLEIALILEKEISGKNNLPDTYYFRTFPKSTCLTFSFKGPYNYLSLAYKKLDQYIEEEKTKLTGWVFEIYINNSINTKSPYDYLTKICYPI